MNRIRAFFGRRRLARSQELEALREEVRQYRHAAALYASLHGADLRPGANCDTELHHKFVQLDKDYMALEKQYADISYQNMELARENRAMKDRILGWERP